MEESLKARLIGAAVLVALAVLLVPELLSGRKAVAPVAEEDAGVRGTRTFTIELGQAGGQAQRGPAVAPAPQAMPPAKAPLPATEAQSGPERPVQQPVAGEPPAEPPHGPADARPGQVAEARQTAPVKTAPAPVKAEQAPVPASAPVAASGGWAVQVGAFGSADTARKLARELGAEGYRAFVSPVSRNGQLLHRVRVGPEVDRASADLQAQRLKGRGLPATVVQND